MAQQEPFQYQEQIGRGAFRVFLIQPCPDVSAPLKGKLIATTLEEYDNSILHHYIALSYVWGNKSDRRTAFIDGKRLDITATLDSALRHIRDPMGELKVWADGICINQADVKERNIQVQQMGLIYQLARHTIIYLGESTPTSAALLDALVSFSSSLENRGSGYMANIARLLNYGSDDAFYPKLVPRRDVQVFAGILIAQEWWWFCRIWVLQELVLSLDPWVQIGLQRVRWDIFVDFLQFCSQNGDLPEDLLHALTMIKFRNTLSPSLWRRQVSNDSNSAARLLDLLASRRGLGATDPRDMIYGHLGLLGVKDPNNKLDKIIQVDYNQPVSELFTQVVLYMISARRRFDIFSHVRDAPIEKRTNFPTWVPDWTYPYSPREDVADLDNDVSSTVDIGQLYVPPSIGDPQVLGLFGRYEGTIETVLNPKPPRVDLKALCESLSQSHRSNSFDAKRRMIEQVYVILHGRLSEWFFEKGVAPSVVSRLTPRSYYDVTFQAIKNKNWEILWDWIAAHVDGPSHLLGPAPSIDDSKITEELHIMTALLLGMTDTSGPGSFPREKIAILKDGALMLVPQCARAGDLVCQFCPDPKPWVIRKLQPGNRVELDAKLLKYFKRLSWSGFQGSIAWLGRSDKNPYTAESALSVLSCRSVEHFNFIGSCRPEPKFPDGTPEYERHTSIFALH